MEEKDEMVPDKSVIESFLEALSWEGVIDILNSSFVSSLFGALCGAAAGAFAAHWFMVSHSRRQERIQLIRNVNTAISFAAGLCNFGTSLKGQHLLKLKQDFESSRTQVIEHRQKFQQNPTQVDPVIRFGASIDRFPIPTYPVDNLCSVVFDRLSIPGKPLSAAASAKTVYEQLIHSIERRNELVDLFRSSHKSGDPELVYKYFGLRTPDGHVDTEFPDLLYAIVTYTDDLIYFSKLLCDELIVHGKKATERLPTRVRRGVPNIASVDWTAAKERGLIPDEKQFEDWNRGFGNHPTQ